MIVEMMIWMETPLYLPVPFIHRVAPSWRKWHQQANKRLPRVLPYDISDNQPIQKLLILSEQMCHLCQSTLHDPREITNRAMILGLTKLLTGTNVYLFPYPIKASLK